MSLNRSLLSALLVLCLLQVQVGACGVCIGFPEQTATDYLLSAKCVVLARPDESDPFTFKPREMLKGRGSEEPIDLLVDTATRRRLAVDRERSVLLVQSQADGTWRSLGVASPRFEAVVRRIVTVAATWESDAGANERAEFFYALFDDSDPSVRELAYLEMGRAPYAMIRRLGKAIDVEVVMPKLTDVKFIEWRSLAILLIAQKDSPECRQRIIQALRSAERFGLNMNLAAWIVAGAEVAPDETFRLLQEKYLSGDQRSVEEIAAVASALSVIGSNCNDQCRNQVVECYRSLLGQQEMKLPPGLVGQVTSNLSDWQRADLVNEVADFEKRSRKELRLAERRLVTNYLRWAASQHGKMHLTKQPTHIAESQTP